MKLTKKNILVGGCLTALIIGVKVFFVGQILSVDFLQKKEIAIRAFKAVHPFETFFLFFLADVAVTSLSIPGVALFALAGGILFGFRLGLLFVTTASSIGAATSFLLARYLFLDFLKIRYRERLEGYRKRLRENGVSYLFCLRLMPVVPGVVLNILAALSPMKLETFFAITFAGTLPMTAAYVNAGTRLGEIHRLQDVFTPRLLLSWLTIGFLPVLAKYFLQRRSKKKKTTESANLRP